MINLFFGNKKKVIFASLKQKKTHYKHLITKKVKNHD